MAAATIIHRVFDCVFHLYMFSTVAADELSRFKLTNMSYSTEQAEYLIEHYTKRLEQARTVEEKQYLRETLYKLKQKYQCGQ